MAHWPRQGRSPARALAYLAGLRRRRRPDGPDPRPRRDLPSEDAAPRTPISPRSAFAGNVAVGVFHPKTIVFFVAFAPQFIDPRGSYALQAAMLVATFGLVVGATDTAYALAASRASRLLRTRRAIVWSKRTGGGVLIAAGIATAASRN